jgi:sugar lactone lactonase YvrE
MAKRLLPVFLLACCLNALAAPREKSCSQNNLMRSRPFAGAENPSITAAAACASPEAGKNVWKTSEKPGFRSALSAFRTGEAGGGESPREATLDQYRITNTVLPECALPPSVTVFSSTAPQAYVWFSIDGVRVGDVFRTDYYTPSGTLYTPRSGSYPPEDEAGDFCFNERFPIAGTEVAAMPGVWTVRAYLNGAPLFTLTFTIQGSSCTYSLNPLSRDVPAAGGSGSVAVVAGTGCSWTAASQANWITISAGSSGSGNGTVNYQVAANTGPAERTGTVTVGGATHTVRQAGSGGGGAMLDKYLITNALPSTCTFSSPPASVTAFPSTAARAYVWFSIYGVRVGDVFRIDYYTPSGTLYTPRSGSYQPEDEAGDFCLNEPFPIAGTEVAAMPGVWTVRAYLNQAPLFTLTFTIQGAPCTYSLSPASGSFNASGGTGNVSVVAGNGCAWTASSSAGWITVSSGGTGSGNGTVTYQVAANTVTASRTATLTIAGQTHTVTQAGVPACEYTVSPASESVPSGGGSRRITISTASGCNWTATTSATWISITAGASGSGNGSVEYTVAANPTSTARTGTISVAGRSVSVSQAGASAVSSLTVISTFAGTDWAFPRRPQPALEAPLGQVAGAYADGSGNLFIADPDNCIVAKVAADGTLSIVAGNGFCWFSGDGGQATDASLWDVSDVQADSSGTLYIADKRNHRIRKVDPNGIITTIAGTGTAADSGDGGRAIAAGLDTPYKLALDRRDNTIYVSTRTRVRKIAPDGTISTYAGNGEQKFAGDGGAATAASLSSPGGVAVDAAGNVYIADWVDNRVRRVDAATGVISTYAGNGNRDFTGDGGPAVDAALKNPEGLSIDEQGNLYIADMNNRRVRKVDVKGFISTIAGDGTLEFKGDGGPATAAGLFWPQAVAADRSGAVFIGDTSNFRLRRVGADGIIQTVAGNGKYRANDAGTAASAAFFLEPEGLAVDQARNTYVADTGRHIVWKIDAGGGISRFAGTGANGCCNTGNPLEVALSGPSDVAIGPDGGVYISDRGNARILKVLNGTATEVAGNTEYGHSGDGEQATSARLRWPEAIAFDRAGNLYIVDGDSHRIRKVAPDGIITTFAGNGERGFSGDGGPATAATLRFPAGVAVDASGNVYISDQGNARIRQVNTAGVITTVAGNGIEGMSGDGGPAIQASLFEPERLAVDNGNNLYIADAGNERIRMVGSNGTIQTIAGIGRCEFSGDGGSPVSAGLCFPKDLEFTPGGALLIADHYNNRIRALTGEAVSLRATPASLTFTGFSGAQAGEGQRIDISASGPGLRFSTSVAYVKQPTCSDRPGWLRVTPSNGAVPAAVMVSADPAALPPDQYCAVLTVNAAGAPPQDVAVTLSVLADPNPPKLGFEPSAVEVSVVQESESEQVLWVTNQGGRELSFTADTRSDRPGWLRISTSGERVTPNEPGTVTLAVNALGVEPGTYTVPLLVSSSTTREELNVPVTVIVSPPRRPKLYVSRRALAFRAIIEGGDFDQTVGVLNIGDGDMPWTASASSDRGWLSISPASGSTNATSLAVPEIAARVNVAGLATGNYRGQITVSAPGSTDGTQVIEVSLAVLTDNNELGPRVNPTGLIFTIPPDGTRPGSKEITAWNVTSRPTSFDAFLGPREAESLFEFSPSRASLAEVHKRQNAVSILKFQPRASQAGAIVREGTLTFKFERGVNRNVNVLLFAPAAGTPATARAAAGDCTATSIYPVFTNIDSDFRATSGMAFALELQIADGCGRPVTAGSVVASFSNGDAPVTLVSLKDGRWTGTWMPRNAGPAGIRVRVRPAGSTLKGEAQAGGIVQRQ